MTVLSVVVNEKETLPSTPSQFIIVLSSVRRYGLVFPWFTLQNEASKSLKKILSAYDAGKPEPPSPPHPVPGWTRPAFLEAVHFPSQHL